MSVADKSTETSKLNTQPLNVVRSISIWTANLRYYHFSNIESFKLPKKRNIEISIYVKTYLYKI